MVYSYQETKKLYKDDYNLRKALKEKKLYKLYSGVYADKPYVDPMVIVCKKYQGAILTMDSAFYFHNLTDVVPDKVFVVTEKHAHSINDSSISQSFLSSHLLELGKIEETTIDGKINIYNKERMLIELARRKKQIKPEYYTEIINNYKKIANTLNTKELESYLAVFNNEEINKIIKNEVFN